MPDTGPKWRNWQTRTTQNRVPVRVCGFDSHLRHQSPDGYLKIFPAAKNEDFWCAEGIRSDTMDSTFGASHRMVTWPLRLRGGAKISGGPNQSRAIGASLLAV